MNYRNEWINAVCGKVESQEIEVRFKNGREVVYTMDIFDLLKTDPAVEYITSLETGEILWCRD